MIDPKALAYVNMYGVLGALENLCALDAEARAVLAGLKRPIALCFAVKDGPVRTFRFSADVHEADGSLERRSPPVGKRSRRPRVL